MQLSWPGFETAKTPVVPPAPKGVVVLLHGLGANSWMMSLLAQRLKWQGYQVENWGYYSVWQSLGQLTPLFESKFKSLQSNLPDDMPLHIVAHSMGSIITRAALSNVELPSLKRVVMLSPPNRGSHVATMVGPYLRWLTPLVEELSDREDSFVNRLSRNVPTDLQVGVIAAEWDYVLREISTHIECEVDHIMLPSRHTGLVLRRRAAEQILHFLEHGRFHREPCELCAPLDCG
ncbi:esterase/lipase family protein [Planctomicrobium piriforme]|uniref:Serine aminopeptidase, S33 n=1 Tax=Planctomicrobium piriforme TaxID=1576369 RepID=A0A1I3GN69_9PLAN|nr:alpha/beta hydrolase [Planctomicrobium piriforme]SFI24870.1 Serine aminopeptidase, S33 [Planctomicrobium piriforme]